MAAVLTRWWLLPAMLAIIWLFTVKASAEPVPPHGDRIVETRHTVTLGPGRRLNYTARAGLLPLYVNDTGERMASIFFISYSVDRPAGSAPRPITFLWNGGPGSNSAQVHIVGFGPRRVATADTYPEFGPNTETAIVNHPETWLEHSDLVFVDPVGTGFSRATSRAFRDILYTGHGDAEAVAEMIRLYLTRFNRWNAPLFIGGESYGTTRAMLVADALVRRRTPVEGVILISGGYNAGQQMPQPLAQALAVTEMVATAHYHQRMAPELQALPLNEALARATDWARNTYAPALARRERLSATERAALLADLRRFTGIDGRHVDTSTLLIRDFTDHLLEDRGLELGRYDGRMTVRARPEGQAWFPTGDPSLEPMADLMNGTSRVFNAYIRDDLGFESDLLYRGPFGRAFHPEPLTTHPQTGLPSDWMAAMFNVQAGVNNDPPPLQRAMRADPRLRVWNIKGLYDGSCAALDEAVAQTEPDLRRRVINSCVPAGHMLYTDLAVRRTLKNDFAAFIRSATEDR